MSMLRSRRSIGGETSKRNGREDHGQENRTAPSAAGGGSGGNGGLDDRLVRAVDPHHQDRSRHPAHRPAGAVRGNRRVRRRADAQAVGQGARDRRQGFPCRDRHQGQRVESGARRRRRRRPDPEGQGRPHPRLLDPGNHQPGGRSMRAGTQALHLDGRALAALVLRPRREARQGLRLDLSFLLGPRGHHRHVHLDVEQPAHQQGGRWPVPQ